MNDETNALWDQSPRLDELAKALVEVQRTLRPALKDATNPHFKSKYADLESVMDAVREPLATNGLALLQTTEPDPQGVILVTTLLHVSGQFMRGRLRMVPQRNDPQGIGSCITYARRYGAAAIVGLSQTDDDGESASGRGDGGRPSAPSLARPQRVAEPEKAAPLTLTGGSFEEEYGRLVNPAELRSLMGLLDKHAVSTDALKRFVDERWQVKSRKELRVRMLPVISEWITAEGKEVA